MFNNLKKRLIDTYKWYKKVRIKIAIRILYILVFIDIFKY